jgi:hypothetical protein
MDNDRRAKMVELAEAMHLVWRFQCEHQDGIASGNCPPHILERSDKALNAAAERLDKAMVAWMNDALWQRNQVAVSDESFVHLLNKISGVTPSLPDELPDPPPRTADFLHPSEIYVVYERGTKGDSNA